jgi:hypothetical protein
MDLHPIKNYLFIIENLKNAMIGDTCTGGPEKRCPNIGNLITLDASGVMQRAPVDIPNSYF